MRLHFNSALILVNVLLSLQKREGVGASIVNSRSSTSTVTPSKSITSGEDENIYEQIAMGSNEERFDHQRPENNSAMKSTQGKEKINNLNSLVTLDLAGQFDIHVSSPTVVAGGEGNNNVDTYRRSVEAGGGLDDPTRFSTTPLFRWGETSRSQNIDRRGIGGCLSFPHVHLSGKYNFKRVWYGLTRLGVGMSWGAGAGATANHQKNRQRRGRNAVGANISAEKGLLSPNDYSLDVDLAFPTMKTLFQDDSTSVQRQAVQVSQLPTSIGLRYETINSHHQNKMTATVTAKTSFLHPRVQIVGRSILKLRESTLLSAFTNLSQPSLSPLSSSPFFARIQQRKFQLSDELSWVPDIKMTPGGRIISNSSFGLCPMKNRGEDSNIHINNNGKNRIGVRLSVKKQFNWNILGSIFQQQQQQMLSMSYDDDDDREGYNSDTAVCLEVCGVTGVNSYTSFSVEAALERFRETFHCTFLQEGVIN